MSLVVEVSCEKQTALCRCEVLFLLPRLSAHRGKKLIRTGPKIETQERDGGGFDSHLTGQRKGGGLLAEEGRGE